MADAPKLRIKVDTSGLERDLSELEQRAFLLEQRYERIVKLSKDALRYAVELQKFQNRQDEDAS